MLKILFDTFAKRGLPWHVLCYARVVDTRVCGWQGWGLVIGIRA